MQRLQLEQVQQLQGILTLELHKLVEIKLCKKKLYKDSSNLNNYNSNIFKDQEEL